MKLESIRIQGMHNVKDKTYNLSNFNYITGNNGAGKTTILQAIQLALLGYIPGTKKQNEAIFKHSNNMHMSVELVLDAVTIKRSWRMVGTKLQYNLELTPQYTDSPEDEIKSIIANLELPLFNFTEFMGMTANTLKDWFIDFLPAEDAIVDWNAELGECTNKFEAILDPEYVSSEIANIESDKETATLPLIRKANAKFKSDLSYSRDELKRIESSIQGLVFYDDCEILADTDALRQEILALDARKDKLNRETVTCRQNMDIKAKICHIESSLISLEDYESAVENHTDAALLKAKAIAQIESTNTEVSQLERQISEYNKIIEGDSVCPYTNNVCNIIEQQIPEMEFQLGVLRLDHNNLSNKLKEYTSNKEVFAVDEAAYARIIDEYTVSNRALEQLRSQLNQTAINLDLETIKSEIAETIQKINQYNDLIIKVEANKNYNRLIDKLTSDKYKVQQRIEILKSWIKLTDVNGLQSSIMDKPFIAFSNTITKYLRKLFDDNSLCCKFILSEKVNSFDIGLTRDGSEDFISFDLLSSGERCLFALALLVSIVEVSKPILPLVLIDDLLDHLDATRINGVFNSLYNIDTVQIILAGIRPCNHKNANQFVIEVK